MLKIGDSAKWSFIIDASPEIVTWWMFMSLWTFDGKDAEAPAIFEGLWSIPSLDFVASRFSKISWSDKLPVWV